MTAAAFQKIAPGIPAQPGIYKYYDDRDTLLYVGKAKHLRKRISSYFTKNLTSYKTHELVQRIHHIGFTVVDSEQDAFLLENTLIKQYQPRYNINLKDDKTYPFLVIKNEAFPRVFLTRNKLQDGSEYLGPYTSVKKVRELLEFIRQTIPLRTCSLHLTERNIQKGRFKVCLEYHLGNCKGPCQGFQSAESYQEDLHQVRNLLRGNLSPVIRHLKEEMKHYSFCMYFEKAAIIKKKIEFLQLYKARSVVANARAGNLDVFSIELDTATNHNAPANAFVNYLMVRNGSVIQAHNTRLESKLNESKEDMLLFAIAQLRSNFNSDASEIVIPFPVAYPGTENILTVPRAGDKKKLLDLSQKNIVHYKEEIRHRERLHTGKTTGDIDILRQLQKDLHLQELPVHIECFDNSNLQGSFPVSAMVCFKNGLPSKKDYRRFNVKTVAGINDFATMKEAVFRRYQRLKKEGSPFPQLVIIDGGKGQLGAALNAARDLELPGSIRFTGLAKNEEELFFAGDQESLKLPLNSHSLKFIRQIRNEVHRFGIAFHRKKRSKGTFKNELQEIKGIGTATAGLLLKEYRSVKNIREIIRQGKGEKEFSRLIGSSRAHILIRHFTER